MYLPPRRAKMWKSPDPWAQAASRHGGSMGPCRDGKLSLLIGLRLGRVPPGLGLAFAVMSSQESLWRIPAAPGGPAALNLASHFSILSAGFVVVTPLQVAQMAILRRPDAQTPDLLDSTVEVENILLSPPEPERELLSMHFTTTSTIP
ncbi:hypothetical protein LA080_014796 [Diaporthe eres]|nr:hypothetical protein LA080_014796 [Diaporthe eres]